MDCRSYRLKSNLEVVDLTDLEMVERGIFRGYKEIARKGSQY